jgi:hypothetical protein
VLSALAASSAFAHRASALEGYFCNQQVAYSTYCNDTVNGRHSWTFEETDHPSGNIGTICGALYDSAGQRNGSGCTHNSTLYPNCYTITDPGGNSRLTYGRAYHYDIGHNWTLSGYVSNLSC